MYWDLIPVIFPDVQTTMSSPYYCNDKTVSGVYTLSEPHSVFEGQDVCFDIKEDGSTWLVTQVIFSNSSTDAIQRRGNMSEMVKLNLF